MLCDNLAARRALLFQLILLCNKNAPVKSGFEVNLVNVTGVYDKSALQYFDVCLHEVDGRNVMRLKFELRRLLPAFKMHVKVRTISSNIIPRYSLNSITDGCQVLRSTSNGNYLIRSLFTLLRRGNASIPKQCPVKANKRYGIDRFDVMPDVFNSYLPSMRMQSNVSIFAQNKIVFSVLLHLQAVQK